MSSSSAVCLRLRFRTPQRQRHKSGLELWLALPSNVIAHENASDTNQGWNFVAPSPLAFLHTRTPVTQIRAGIVSRPPLQRFCTRERQLHKSGPELCRALPSNVFSYENASDTNQGGNCVAPSPPTVSYIPLRAPETLR